MYLSSLMCWLIGHRAMLLEALGHGPMITIHEGLGQDLVDVHMCRRCHLLFWIPAQPKVKPLLLTGPSQPDVGKGVSNEPTWH